MNLYIDRTGTLRAVSSEAAEKVTRRLGATDKRRASNVVPANWFKRAVFRLLRATFTAGDPLDLAIIAHTRTWRGPWQVRFAETPGKVEFQHASRHVCIKWEIDQLEAKFAAQ